MTKVWGKWSCPLLSDVGIEQIGVGAFYYIASTAVIGVVNYAGNGRTDQELALFFALFASVVLAATVASALSLSLRDRLADFQGIIFVLIVLAAIGCACLSMFALLQVLFYVSALLTGCVCALLTLSWERSLSRMPIRTDLFALPSALLMAVICYFVYRGLAFLSLMAADGWHVTVGVVGMLALLLAYSPEYSESESENGGSRSFFLLGAVAAVFATGGGLLAFFAGFPGSERQAQFTPYFILEIVGALAIALCCVCGGRLLSAGKLASAQSSRLYFLTGLVLLLALGAVSGLVLASNSGNGLLWEASAWVLVVAALALGMRTSLYLIRGTVIGVLFGAWCLGQSVALSSSLFGGPWYWLAAGALALVYLGAVMRLIDRRGGYSAPKVAVRAALGVEARCEVSEEESLELGGNEPAGTAPRQGASIKETCHQIGEEYRLTAREIEVLCLISEGRSARFIADELVISYNTARSHMRNVYEKLGIHAKQEIISLVQSWN